MDITVYRHFNRDTNENKYDIPDSLPRRDKTFATQGKEIAVKVNSYTIVNYPDKKVSQYDIQVGSGVEKRALVKKVWHSKAVKAATGPSWIFDGNKIAWALDSKPSVTLTVDLDAEDGITSRPDRENKHRVVIRKVGEVPVGAVKHYLSGQMSFDTSVLQGINFLDHLLRHGPSLRLTSIKQSFFSQGRERCPLGKNVEAFKGVYQTIRACQGGRLAVNVDVSNGVFWSETTIAQAMLTISGESDYAQLLKAYDKPDAYSDTGAMSMLRRMRKVGVYAKHRGAEDKNKLFIIDKFIKTNAKEYKFKVRDRVTKVETETTVFDYFRKKYNIPLQHWQLPLIQTTKKGVILPAEVVIIAPNQRFPFKLDDRQTANMIKFAVTRPSERAKDIEHGLSLLKWNDDPFLRNYGMRINSDMVTTKARLLPPPTVEFKGSRATPGTSGRWDLKGKRFLLPNPKPLVAWGVFLWRSAGPRNLSLAQTQQFVSAFVMAYTGHGGVVATKQPIIHEHHSIADGLKQLYEKITQQHNGGAQMILVILPDRNSWNWRRVKKSCDCRWGVVSQCVQSISAAKAAPQYLSNVCMKFNAKLGGTTARVPGKKADLGCFAKPSMIIGADVSHASPGSTQASMAAVAVMADKLGVRYHAACETNGHRVEMITTKNLEDMLIPQVNWFIQNVGKGTPPEVVFYFRDGVSEGQYQHVLHQEVRDIRALMQKKWPKWKPKFVVVVASKRHHIRFFPGNSGDKNGNPLPGTLVERDVTHPFERDVYLNSHSAIQGTARPVHYHVLMDEAGIPEGQLYTMIYEQCYQYIRSTTPVSLHPAVYYAHLASNRAASHINEASSSGPQSGPGFKPSDTSSHKQKDVEYKPLILMTPKHGIVHSMWFI